MSIAQQQQHQDAHQDDIVAMHTAVSHAYSRGISMRAAVINARNEYSYSSRTVR